MFRFLSHSRHATSYTSFFLYEIEISDELKNSSMSEILDKFIKNPYFRDQSQWHQEKFEKNVFTHTAFIIEDLSIEDFKMIKGKDIAEIVISCLDKESWREADLSLREDYRDTFNKSKWFPDELKIENDQVFYLNLDWFVDSEKLVDPYWIWDYALAFILINQSKTKLIMLDYGMD